MSQNNHILKVHPFARIWLFLLLLLPLASHAQNAKSPGNELEVFGGDSDLLFGVEVLSLSQRVYKISFKNVGTQMLLVPDGSFLFFHLFANKEADGGISTIGMEMCGGIDHPAFNFADTMKVTLLHPGESATYTFEETGAEKDVVIPLNQMIRVQVGYMVYNGNGPNSDVDSGFFLRSAREVTVFQRIQGDHDDMKPPKSFGYYGTLNTWKRN